MGIPAIGSDSGEIPNVIGNPDLVFPEGDAEATRIEAHRNYWTAWYKDLSQQCIARVEKYYSHAHCSKIDRPMAIVAGSRLCVDELPKRLSPFNI